MKMALNSFGMLVGVLLLLVTGASARSNPATEAKRKAAPGIGEVTDLNAFLSKYDLSHLWTTTESSEIFGFIGAGYQRLQIHFLSVTKDRNDPATYLVEGKTLVRKRVRQFEGKIVVESVAVFLLPSALKSYDREHGLSEGVISGWYLFRQDRRQEGTGAFEGTLRTYYYIDKRGAIHYDDLEVGADGYTNNDFVGAWKSYRGTVVEECNWGDYRIPDCGDLDVGAGDFYPNEKYIKNGWQTFVAEQDEADRTGKKPKEKEWWK